MAVGVTGIDGGDGFAAPENGDPVGDSQDLVKFVGDEDNAEPVGSHSSEGGDQTGCLLWSEHRGRFVEDEDARAAIEGAENFDPLLFTDGELPNSGARVDLEIESFAEFGDCSLDRLGFEPGSLTCATEKHVFGDSEWFDQHEVLVDHPDSMLDRVTRRVELNGLTVNCDCSGIRAIQTSKHAHQRALPSPILSNQRVNFTNQRIELDTIVGDDPGEPFGNPSHLYGVR
jgi:hypothetical protein